MNHTEEKTNNEKYHTNGPMKPDVEEHLEALMAINDDPESLFRAQQLAGAIAFVHFDANSAKSHMAEALVHHEDLLKIHRGLYVRIESLKDNRVYTGRVVEGPFFAPDALKRDSTPVQFIILNQGQAKSLALPEYHGWMQVELLGEERKGVLYGVSRRPHPASPIFPYDAAAMSNMLRMKGNIVLGLLDNYDDVLVRIDESDKGVVPRNWLTVGTIGSGKSNTNQVFIEETLATGYAQIVIDPEGEYIFMDRPSDIPNLESDLEAFDREPQAVKSMTVYRPPKAMSKRSDAIEFSVPFDSISPDVIVELVEMTTAQQTRYPVLYEQAIKLVRKKKWDTSPLKQEDLDVTQGYPGVKLSLLIKMLEEELTYYSQKSKEKKTSRSRKKTTNEDNNADSPDNIEPDKIYCHQYQLKPLIQDQHDETSYRALLKKLNALQRLRIFDRTDAPELDMAELCKPGHLSVIDMSDAHGQQVVNIVIADLLARMYHYKMSLSEKQNTEHKVFITIEEAHGFISRQKQDKMEQTLDQLRRIARRGRKRWLALHFVTQSPQHLPPELFELANNKIIHQTTGSVNLSVLKSAAGAINEGVWNDVPSLGRGRAIIVSSQFPHPIIVRIRPAASHRAYMI